MRIISLYLVVFRCASLHQLFRANNSRQRSQTCLGIYVAKSDIEGAGGGVFARRRFEMNEVVAEYRGQRVTTAELRGASVNKTYILRGAQGYINALDPEGRLLLNTGRLVNTHKFTNGDWSQLNGHGVSWVGDATLARFANDSRNPNARIRGNNFVAKRVILPEEEITINYGYGTVWRT